MALVPFRVAGAAASQQLGEQLLQIGQHSLLLHQRPKESGNTTHLQRTAAGQQDQQQAGTQRCKSVQQAAAMPAEATTAEDQPQRQQQQQPDLSRVGLVLWQSGYVLSDFLLLRLPQLHAGRHNGSSSSGSWAGARVLELGCGAGTVGMFLAVAGAQVVLTDLPHILPLTQENLELNFPLTSSTGDSSSAKSSTFGCRVQAAGLHTCQAEHPSVGGGQQETPAWVTPAVANRESYIDQQQPAAAALSASAAFTAAFCSAAVAQTQVAGQLQSAGQPNWQALSAGPLVVEHSWGEPTVQLQQRIAAAAAVRFQGATARSPVQQLQLKDQQGQQQQQRQQQQCQEPGGLPLAFGSGPYDFVVGADLLYDPTHHQALLCSLQQLCAPHTQVFLCYRCRALGEETFMRAAADAGWAVEEVPCHLLHPEYQGGEYQVLRMMKTG